MQLGMVGTDERGVGMAVVPFEVMEGMEGEHNPETGVTRFERRRTCLKVQSLRWPSMLFSGSPELDPHLLWALWRDLRLPMIRLPIQEGKAGCFKVNASPQDLE